MKRLQILFVFLVVGVYQLMAADLKLPSLVANHMVLQQQTTIIVWGWGKPNSVIKISENWSKKTQKTTVQNDGKWNLELQTPTAGGPYEMKIVGDTTIILKDILIGEVWLCSGQSNMDMPLNGYNSQPVEAANDVIAQSSNNFLRIFNVKQKLSLIPLDTCIGEWKVAGPQSVRYFSATAYFYGRYLQSVLGIPVGLLVSTVGGTPIQCWMEKSILENEFPEISLYNLKKTPLLHWYPTVLFNGMINPILNYRFKGAIWYQGESHVTKPEEYKRLFPRMVKNWRDRFNQGEFPFYYVQIAPYKYDSLSHSPEIREIQLKSMSVIPNSGMAVTMDVGEKECIHPSKKDIVGKRLAYWALGKTYNIKGIDYNGPILNKMRISGDTIILNFNNAAIGFTTFGKPMDGFVMCGIDKVFYPAKAFIYKRLEIAVICDKVKQPVAVRYGWANYIEGTLFNTSGLPASSFRTDE